MPTYHVKIGTQDIGRFYVPEPADDSPDPVLVSIAHQDGRQLVGIDFANSESATVGHWPEGEEWIQLGDVHPVEPA